jgi:hypothetical protein
MPIQRAELAFPPHRKTQEVEVGNLFMSNQAFEINGSVNDAVFVRPEVMAFMSSELPQKVGG